MTVSLCPVFFKKHFFNIPESFLDGWFVLDIISLLAPNLSPTPLLRPWREVYKLATQRQEYEIARLAQFIVSFEIRNFSY